MKCNAQGVKTISAKKLKDPACHQIQYREAEKDSQPGGIRARRENLFNRANPVRLYPPPDDPALPAKKVSRNHRRVSQDE
jgi:hypothetical protein